MSTTEELALLKAQAEVKKAVAEADKAQAEALKAQMGEISSAGLTGNVTVEDKAGTIEASLLATRAVESAADKIVKALPKQESIRSILVFTTTDLPKFQAQIAFSAQIRLVENAFENAKIYSEAIGKKAGLEVVGLALEAVQIVAGLFKTDYTFGSSDTDFEKDTLLIHALVGRIVNSDKNLDVKLPAMYSPGSMTEDALKIINKINELSRIKQIALVKKSGHQTSSDGYAKQSSSATSEDEKASYKEKAEQQKNAVGNWEAAIQLYDNLIKKYTTADDKGIFPITNVLNEGIVANALIEGNLLLTVKLHSSGGSYYTINNFWRSIICKKPIYFMGGVVASFVLFDGKSGAIINSGVIPIHGGFFNIDEVKKIINQT